MTAGPHFFTVFTPTYNRAHTLQRVFDSLQAQTFRDFEWLVVDDGSTDDTESLVGQWAAQADFPVRFFRQNHRHKKAAFNRGVREAQGQLFLTLDSDDRMPADALATLRDAWLAIPAESRDGYASVTGLCVRPDGSIVGDRYPQDVMDSTPIDMYFCHSVRGEKFGFTRTDLLTRFPFPEHIEGFVPESVVWWAIARAGYRSRFINKTVRYYEDSADSISRASVRDTAPGLYLLSHDMLAHDLRYFWRRPKDFLMAAARHVRFGLHLGKRGRRATCPRGSLGLRASALCTLAVPVGLALYWRDLHRSA